MSKSKLKPRVLGNTDDDKMVIGGEFFFFMSDTHGLPLSVSMDYCDKYNLMIGWLDYIDAALKQGWKSSKILSSIREAFADSDVWEDKKEVILRRVEILLSKKEK